MMHRLFYQRNAGLIRSRASFVLRNPSVFSSISTALEVDKNSSEVSKRLQVMNSELDRFGVRRYLDFHKSSALLLSAKERVESFDCIWLKILKAQPQPEIDVVNKYLYCMMDCGMCFDAHKILRDLKDVGLKPNIRTFGAFIRQSCSRGNMEETSSYLQLLQESRMVPDLNIFSHILYGYLKAGSPEEVTSTQEIMRQLGSWPSRIGYEGLLTAHAELGDRSSLLETLNEACDALVQRSHIVDESWQSLPFSNGFLVQLYTKLHCALPASEEPCLELLSRLPLTLDPLSRSRAREGIKRLLAFGRMESAAVLFKRTDPESADDAYLVSLARYANVGGLEMDEIMRFWRLAEVSGARLNMLRRVTSNGFRRESTRFSDLFIELQEAFLKKDIDGIFEAIRNKKTEASSTVYNYAIPQLLHLGVTPEEVMKRIQPDSVRPAAAFGCLLGMLAPITKDENAAPVIDIKKAQALGESLKKQQFLPYNDFISLSPLICRRMVQQSIPHASQSKLTPADFLAEKLTVLGGALNSVQLTAVFIQMFASLLNTSRSTSTDVRLSPRDKELLRILVDTCLLKNIKFPPNSWIFYTLENAEIPPEKCEKLKLLNQESDPFVNTDRRTSFGHRLRAAIMSRNIEGALTMIRQMNRPASGMNSDINKTVQTSAPNERPGFLLDPVAMSFSILKVQLNEPNIESNPNRIRGNDVEQLFWASWDAQILPNPLRAIGQVATTYFQTKDMDGLASYFDRCTNRFGNMLESILTPQNMKGLLDHDFSSNLQLLERMIASPFLPLSVFVSASCTLDSSLHQYVDKSSELEKWKRGSQEYWPLQVLKSRFQGLSHLQKLRIIHNTVEDLCKSSNLFAAHSLRIWATQLGLLLFPKTNELLVLSPYFAGTQSRSSVIEKWSLSHELCQHSPVSLSTQQLQNLNALITLEPECHLLDAARNTATWLIDNITRPRSQSAEVDVGASNCLPTWLVVDQYLQYTGSCFNQPKSWFVLGAEWLNKVTETSTWQKDFIDWVRYAPNMEYKCALLLAALLNPRSCDWTWKNYLNDSKWIFPLTTSEAILDLPEQQEKQFLQMWSEHKQESAIMQLARALMTLPADMMTIKSAANAFTQNDLLDTISSLVVTKHSLKPNALQFVAETHCDLLPAFFDKVLTKISAHPRCLRFVRELYNDLLESKVDVSKLSVKNQAFLYAATRSLEQTRSDLTTPLQHLSHCSLSESSDSWYSEVSAAVLRQDFSRLLDFVEKLESSERDEVLSLLTYALPRLGETTRLNKFLTVIAERMDGDTLEVVLTYARPFISYGMGEACLALSRLYRGEKLDWFDRACIRYYKLGPLMQMKASTTTKSSKYGSSRTPNAHDELASMLRQPLSIIAETLVKSQSDSVKLLDELAVISSWSIQRRNALLAYLTADGASLVIDRVIALTPEVHRSKQIPYKAFATMISAHSKASNDPDETRNIIQSAFSSLNESSTSDVAACLKGPHVESLFRCWPNDKLPDLIKLVRESSPTERSSINLQLASILVNRNRLDLAQRLIEATGPLPVTFLAGSPRHTLSPDDFKATLNYLRETDPDHVSAFVDTCLRNAVSTTSPHTEKLVDLIRAITDESFELNKVCLLPTLNLLAEFARRNQKLPGDIKKVLECTIESRGPRKQGNMRL